MRHSNTWVCTSFSFKMSNAVRIRQNRQSFRGKGVDACGQQENGGRLWRHAYFWHADDESNRRGILLYTPLSSSPIQSPASIDCELSWIEMKRDRVGERPLSDGSVSRPAIHMRFKDYHSIWWWPRWNHFNEYLIGEGLTSRSVRPAGMRVMWTCELTSAIDECCHYLTIQILLP